MPLTRSCLSKHDQQVLDSIFNPLELTSGVTGAIDADNETELADEEPTTEKSRQARKLEIDAINAAEADKLEEALEIFQQSLALDAQCPTTYNNRAQALRLAGRDDEALADLNIAIKLTDNSQSFLKTRCHAYCQRGVLNRKREELEKARIDFEEAAKLGSKFARTQLVEINPFAALCNQMLRQAFDQLK